MARRHSRRRSRHSFKIPVVTTAILLGQGFLAWTGGGGNIGGAANVFQSFYTGIDIAQREAVPQNLLVGWGPFVVKGFVGKVARGVGGRPHVPFGLPISIS